MTPSLIPRVIVTTILTILPLIALTPLARAQQPTLDDPLLDAMTGKWVLQGEIRKNQTVQDVEVTWVLNHQYLRIHEISRETTAEHRPQYEAEVFLGWDAARRQYVAHWMDVYGGGFSLTGYADRKAASIPLVFTSPDSAFHTTFTYDEHNQSWHWTMDNEQNGERRPFARLTMTK